MSIASKLSTSNVSLTGELPAVADEVCACAEDEHRWSNPALEVVDTVGIRRWRCTCPRCQCDGLHLVVDPTDTGTPQHLAVEDAPPGEEEQPSGFLGRLLAGLRRVEADGALETNTREDQ